ncbi:MAG: PorT family protein, partial [Bacteroidales bacterium]|nr:PorT family protein [Bacteroidales bacterium]
MKKLLPITFFFIAFSLQAQHKAFQFGFKGGADIGWFKTDSDAYKNDGVALGGSWGFVTDFFLMENYSLTTGFDLLYLNGGMTFPSTSYDPWIPVEGTVFDEYRTKYIQLPVILTMKTNNIRERFRAFGQIGYGLGFLISAKQAHKFISDEGLLLEESTGDFDGFTLVRSAVIIGLG